EELVAEIFRIEHYAADILLIRASHFPAKDGVRLVNVLVAARGPVRLEVIAFAFLLAHLKFFVHFVEGRVHPLINHPTQVASFALEAGIALPVRLRAKDQPTVWVVHKYMCYVRASGKDSIQIDTACFPV